MDLSALTRLLRLASPNLPVGGYSYSQGLETAVASGMATRVEEAERWIRDHLNLFVAKGDAAYWWRLARAFGAGCHVKASAWNAEVLASRDGAEPRSETLQMGHSLVQLLEGLEGTEAIAPLLALDSPTFVAAHAFAVTYWKLPHQEALTAYLWTFLEAQVQSLLKLGQAGQTTGQRLLATLMSDLPGIVVESERILDEEMNTCGPGLSLMSYAHEIQDYRLFRS